jgi:hypothetical protein
MMLWAPLPGAPPARSLCLLAAELASGPSGLAFGFSVSEETNARTHALTFSVLFQGKADDASVLATHVNSSESS